MSNLYQKVLNQKNQIVVKIWLFDKNIERFGMYFDLFVQ